ncbi:hypothetical protein KQX54_005061 [Cotesia glomerata]|uniref:Uncharacterized protein n=1 Tax=Cotesia glomerata TaxID=32391 RepID=A0AAV7ITF2_COTGL|nr:hypothetical protein KQX54_005061 [Cotesia glomerata]
MTGKFIQILCIEFPRSRNNNETETKVQLLEEDQENENSSDTLTSVGETPKRMKKKEGKRGRGRQKLVKKGLKDRPRKLLSTASSTKVEEIFKNDYNEDDHGKITEVVEIEFDDFIISSGNNDWKILKQPYIKSMRIFVVVGHVS